MNIEFLDVELVIEMQSANINEFGGAHGLRDAGLLESALHRGRMRFDFDPAATIPTLAAAVSWGLIKNHPFIDGNKRIGLAALVTFLDSNGYVLAATSEEARDSVLHAAASEWTEDEWTAWVERAAQHVRD